MDNWLVFHSFAIKKNACNRRKGGGKTVIVMYTCKDNLTPLLYSGKIKKKKRKKEKCYREFLSWLTGNKPN